MNLTILFFIIIPLSVAGECVNNPLAYWCETRKDGTTSTRGCNFGYQNEPRGQCFPVPIQRLVANCLSYRNVGTPQEPVLQCAICLPRYGLSVSTANPRETLCVHCATHSCLDCMSDFRQCVACEDNRMLDDLFGETMCLTEKHGLPNCEAVTFLKNKSYGCNTCKPGFFKIAQSGSDAHITAAECVAQTLRNCEVALSETPDKCSRCKIGYYVSKEGFCRKMDGTEDGLAQAVLGESKISHVTDEGTVFYWDGAIFKLMPTKEAKMTLVAMSPEHEQEADDRLSEGEHEGTTGNDEAKPNFGILRPTTTLSTLKPLKRTPHTPSWVYFVGAATFVVAISLFAWGFAKHRADISTPLQ